MKNRKLPSIPTRAELRRLQKFMWGEVVRLNDLKDEDYEKYLKRVRILSSSGFEVVCSEFTHEVTEVNLTSSN